MSDSTVGGLGVLGDRYELGDLLGRGGMAEVRRGRDTRLGRIVAIKLLRADLAADSTFQARFRREAQSAASLNHPSIVAVYDTGEDMLDGVHTPFIVMEYVEGKTLRELLKAHTRFTVERALEVTAGVLAALDYSHRAGIVHRDIKPGNVMITETGDVKVMDFGIARAMSDMAATMTQTSAVMGTAQYLSPEQARGEQADARSDIYATGCVLYELLTGRPPFVGDSLVSVAVSHVRERPTPPGVVDPSIPRDVDAIVMKALVKDRTQRYQSAAEMRADVERAMAGLPVSAGADVDASTSLIPAVEDPVFIPPAVDTEPVAAQEKRGMSWVALTLAVIAVLGLAGFLGWLAFRDSAADQVRVPPVVGQAEADARAAIEARGFAVGDVTQQPDASVPAGVVLEQTPAGNELAEEGTEVGLVVSSGAEQVRVPSRLVGLSAADARVAIENAQLTVGTTTPQDSDQPPNTVLAVDPAEGTQVDAGTAVNLTVSTGSVELPNVVGQPRAQAQATLVQLGFDVQIQEEESATAPVDTVTLQTPPGGNAVPTGTRVVLTVATAPEPVVTPAPTTPEVPPTP